MTVPFELQAEQALLGAILMNCQVYSDIECIVAKDDFFLEINQEMYQAIVDEMQANGMVDTTTISKRDNIKLSYCIELVRNCTNPKSAEHYAKIVKARSIQRQLIAAANDIIEQGLSRNLEIENILADAESRLSSVTSLLDTKTEDTSIKAALKESFNLMDHMVNSENSIRGLSTGFKHLDNRLSGLKKQTMTILAARPSMGKTTLALNIVEHDLLNGGNPLVFSLEMPRSQVVMKIKASVSSVPLAGIMNPISLDDYQWAALHEGASRISKTNLHIIDDACMTVNQMRMAARKHFKMFGRISLIVIDYIQLVRSSIRENRTQELSQVSRDIKAMAKEFDCPVLVLSQLSRDCEKRNNKRPISSDLRESGQIEQDAEDIIFIYRDEVYDEHTPDKGLAELISAKVRLGQIGKDFLQFNGAMSRFEETKRVPAEKPGKTYAERFSA